MNKVGILVGLLLLACAATLASASAASVNRYAHAASATL